MGKKITILGAGSAGMTTAAWLEMDGWEVTLWDTPDQAGDFEAIRRQGGIILRGGSGRIRGMIFLVLGLMFAKMLWDLLT